MASRRSSLAFLRAFDSGGGIITVATTGLLALLDDITVLLDDVALYSKIAAKRCGGPWG